MHWKAAEIFAIQRIKNKNVLHLILAMESSDSMAFFN